MAKKRRKRRLKTMGNLRLWLADIGNRTEQGEIDLKLARTLAYIAQVLRSVIEASDLEKRVAELERLMMEKR